MFVVPIGRPFGGIALFIQTTHFPGPYQTQFLKIKNTIDRTQETFVIDDPFDLAQDRFTNDYT